MADNHLQRLRDVSIATIEWFAKYDDLLENLIMRYCVYLLSSLLLFAGCFGTTKYQVNSLTLESTQPSLTCRVVIPHQLPANAPLVIAYHGIGDTPESMANQSKLDELAARNGFLLVYPDAKGKLWSVPRSDAPNNEASRDVARFDALLQKIEQQYNIDRRQVYVVGMSQGATFVHWLIHERPKRIAAAAAHSGAPPGTIDFTQTTVPIMLIAGQENLVHDPMKTAADNYQAAGVATQFISVPGLGHSWSTTHNEAIWAFLNQEHRQLIARPE